MKLKDTGDVIEGKIGQHTAKIKDKTKIEETEQLVYQKQELEQKKQDLKKQIK